MIANAKLQKTLLSRRPAVHSLNVALGALALLFLIFAVDQHNVFKLSNAISADASRVFGQHEYWRLFTSAWLHADLRHLSANSVFFAGLAFLLNGYFGAWAFPGLSFVAGALINLLVLAAYPDGVTVIGASGIVYFMAAFWLTLYFFVQRGVSPARRLVNALAFALILLIPETADARVSYLAHAVGFALGVPAGAVFFWAKKHEIRSHEVWRMPEPEPQQCPQQACDARFAEQAELVPVLGTSSPDFCEAARCLEAKARG